MRMFIRILICSWEKNVLPYPNEMLWQKDRSLPTMSTLFTNTECVSVVDLFLEKSGTGRMYASFVNSGTTFDKWKLVKMRPKE